MFGVITWLASTKIGRTIATAVGIVLAVGAVILRAFYAGKKAEQAEQKEQTLENMRTRSVSDDKIHQLSGYQRRASLGDWVSDDDK